MGDCLKNPASYYQDKEETNHKLRSWVLSQVAFWIGKKKSYQDTERVFETLRSQRSDVIVFRFQGGNVTALNSEGQGAKGPWVKRISLYQRFFHTVAQTYCSDMTFSLAMSMHDDANLDDWNVPIFAFQKRIGSTALLIPDIDFLYHEFYDDRFVDSKQFEEKKAGAIFVGATTGSGHTVASVNELSNERLRLGVLYRSNPDIDFRLPSIVQCHSKEAEEAIRDLGFGVGAADWSEQLNYKFLLSVDGNGATCSRVAIALKSNSVLLKFNSDNLLFYFSGLVPYENYVPIGNPAEVQDVIDAERNVLGTFAPVAANGREFYRNYLSRASIFNYTASLLRAYFQSFDHSPERSVQGLQFEDSMAAMQSNSPLRLTFVAHISNVGDCICDSAGWVGTPRSGNSIEGFELRVDAAEAERLIEYQVFTDKSNRSQVGRTGCFVGSRNLQIPICGVTFRMLEDPKLNFTCFFRCLFVDGFATGLLSSGEIAKSPSSAALEAFQISLVYRSESDTANSSDAVC